jgi:hypothetical protein
MAPAKTASRPANNFIVSPNERDSDKQGCDRHGTPGHNKDAGNHPKCHNNSEMMRAEDARSLQWSNHEHQECEQDRQRGQCWIVKSLPQIPEAISLCGHSCFLDPRKIRLPLPTLPSQS